jgi:hypothetical protein
VEYAITFFMSDNNKPELAAKIEVMEPLNPTNNSAFGLNSNSQDIFIIRKTPAVTIVAACINAETGVGPSIASGNHVCNKICADFPTAPP